MPRGIAISAPRSGSGKTLVTMALMDYIHNQVDPIQPFKIGPDYIDPLFHYAVTGVPSVNLDTYLMTPEQVRYLYNRYTNSNDSDRAMGRIGVMEGVMGFYDGIDRGSSTYDVTRSLGIPTVIVLPANGISHTLSALLFGLLAYKKDHTIQGVILNHVGSESHYKILYKTLKSDFPDLRIAGWIPSRLDVISSRHLGLNTEELDTSTLRLATNKVLEHVNLNILSELWNTPHTTPGKVEKSMISSEVQPGSPVDLSNRHPSMVSNL